AGSRARLAGGRSPLGALQTPVPPPRAGRRVVCVPARRSRRRVRALGYPLLGVAVVGLCLTLIHGVGVTQNGASRWINIGGQQVQPSEIAKLALARWGADLLARKGRFGQLADSAYMLVPLMPRTGLLCPLVMSGDDRCTTFRLV